VLLYTWLSVQLKKSNWCVVRFVTQIWNNAICCLMFECNCQAKLDGWERKWSNGHQFRWVFVHSDTNVKVSQPIEPALSAIYILYVIWISSPCQPASQLPYINKLSWVCVELLILSYDKLWQLIVIHSIMVACGSTDVTVTCMTLNCNSSLTLTCTQLISELHSIFNIFRWSFQ